MKTSYLSPLVALAVLILPMSRALAAAVTLTPVADTCIFSAFPDHNLGANLSLAIGVIASDSPARGLVKFDPSAAVPAGARVTGAALQLNVVRSPALSEDGEFQIFKLLVPWTEGRSGGGTPGGTGQVASPGEATWDARQQGLQAWAEGGGAIGTDYATTASASAFQVGGAPLMFESGLAIAADVQGWIDQPSANHGWLIKDRIEGLAGTARRYASREDTAQAPTLTIEFESPLRIASTSFANGELCLRFSAKAGKTYQLRRRDEVHQGAWLTVAVRPSTDSDAEATLCDLWNSAMAGRFYRITEE